MWNVSNVSVINFEKVNADWVRLDYGQIPNKQHNLRCGAYLRPVAY